MTIRKTMISFCAATSLFLWAGQVTAATNYYNGQVQYYFMSAYPDGTNYTFVNLSGHFCYTVSTNTGFATILAAKQITGSNVRIACNGNELVQVQQ